MSWATRLHDAPIADRRTVMCLPFSMCAHVRYAQIGIHEYSTRADVRACLSLIRNLQGIGPKSMEIIQAWLDEEDTDA
jgi:hypothetical protein